jgi:hypothetical protein
VIGAESVGHYGRSIRSMPPVANHRKEAHDSAQKRMDEPREQIGGSLLRLD